MSFVISGCVSGGATACDDIDTIDDAVESSNVTDNWVEGEVQQDLDELRTQANCEGFDGILQEQD